MLIDISRTIGLDDLVYPGDPPTELTALANIQLDGYKLTQLSATLHAGTHLDAPSHFISGGLNIDQIPLERLSPIVHLLEQQTLSGLQPELLLGADIQPGDGVLFKTTNSELERSACVPIHAHIPMNMAERLIQLGVSLIGIDYPSIERPNIENYPVHRRLLAAGVLLLEDADLRATQPGRYRLYCFPMKVFRGEAAPCRAVLETL